MITLVKVEEMNEITFNNVIQLYKLVNYNILHESIQTEIKKIKPDIGCNPDCNCNTIYGEGVYILSMLDQCSVIILLDKRIVKLFFNID